MKVKLVLLVLLFSLFYGCKITGEYQVRKDGSGSGSVKCADVNKNYFLSRVKEEKKFSKIIVTSIDSTDDKEFSINFEWKNFEDLFSKMSVEDNGLVKLDFGNVDFPVKVKVPGEIVAEKSTGKLIDNNEIEFAYEKGILYYKPYSAAGNLQILLIISIAVVIAYFAFFRRRKAKPE